MSGQEAKSPLLRFGMSPAEGSEGELPHAKSAKSAKCGRARTTAASWVRKRLGDIADFNPKCTLPDSFEYVDLESVVGTEILTHRSESKTTAPSRAQRLAKLGDVFYQTVRPYQKNNCIFNFDDSRPFVFSTGYAQLRPRCDGYFLLSLVQNDTFVNRVLDECTGTSYPAINDTRLSEILIAISLDNDEQRRIGSFFRSLDTLILGREKALEKLEALKKSMLLKMFPQGDANVPEVRFKGFEGEWEKKRLGDFGDCQSGEGFPEIEQKGEDGIPFFKVSDMNLPGNDSELIRANNYVTEEQIKRCVWHPVEKLPAIFFAKVGAAVMLNRKRLVKMRFLLDNNTMAFRLENTIDVDFAKTLFDTIDLSALSQTGALPSINASDVENLLVLTPIDILEQQKIGAYFRSLDALIAARREEVEKLKQMKKALLERMFV